MIVDLAAINKEFFDVEFFLVCIFANAPTTFQGAGENLNVTKLDDSCWAITSQSSFSQAGLAHKVGENLLLFRGYEVTTGTHSYSPLIELDPLKDSSLLINGVFAYLKYDRVSRVVTVKSDAFGISPLYYRESNGTWLFSSHPSLIYLAGDTPDLMNWACLLQNGHGQGDRGFYDGIKRFPSGTEMSVSTELCKTRQWFDMKALPQGNEPVDDETIDNYEKAYCTSIQRCLSLNVGDVTLPFTSGFDSRRFFAYFVRNKVRFKAVTCRSYNRKNGRDYDIDSIYAPKIAAFFGVDCEVLSACSAEQVAEDSQRRQALIGTETFMHGWAMPLMRWLSTQRPSLIFDGLAGDIFGNSTFDVEGLSGNSCPTTTEIIDKFENSKIARNLSLPVGFTEEFRASLEQYVANFSPNNNQAQLVFLQTRSRRGIAPWASMMHPPGHVVVFPYFDVDFARAALPYNPVQKYRRYLQRACLQRFYPEFYDFAGSRNMPPDIVPVDEAVASACDRSDEERAYSDNSVIWAASQQLRFPSNVLLLIAKAIPRLRKRRDWLFKPLLTLMRTRKQAHPFIHLGVPDGETEFGDKRAERPKNHRDINTNINEEENGTCTTFSCNAVPRN